MNIMIGRRGALAMGGAAALPGLASAQSGRLVRMVVPYSTGGTSDITGRMLAPALARRLNETWIIENRSGASGAIGSNEVARSAPDGTTWLYSNEVLLVLRFVLRQVPFDALTDFTPIARTVSIPYVVVGAAQHVQEPDIAALLATMRSRPDSVTWAGSTLGSIGQLGAEAIARNLGVRTTVVAYRGTGPALNDLLGGAVKLMIAPLGPVSALIRDGRLKAFAVTSASRIPLLPDVPTMLEAGLRDIVFEGWCGMWGPRGLPAEIVSRVHGALSASVAEPEFQERIAPLGLLPIQESPAEFARICAEEVRRTAEIVRAAGIQPE
jgi:tripartite-type tricarboxylate transporter receptor subunit TctC